MTEEAEGIRHRVLKRGNEPHGRMYINTNGLV